MENNDLGLNRPAGGEAEAAVPEAHDWRKDLPKETRQRAVEMLKEGLIMQEFCRRYGPEATLEILNKHRAAIIAEKEEKRRAALNQPQDSPSQSPVSDLAATFTHLPYPDSNSEEGERSRD